MFRSWFTRPKPVRHDCYPAVRFDLLDRYPADVIAEADELTAVAHALGLGRPRTDERIYREILRDRAGRAA